MFRWGCAAVAGRSFAASGAGAYTLAARSPAGCSSGIGKLT